MRAAAATMPRSFTPLVHLASVTGAPPRVVIWQTGDVESRI